MMKLTLLGRVSLVGMLPLLLIDCGGAHKPAGAGPSRGSSAGKEYLVYINSHADQSSDGVYVSRFDAATGAITQPELAVKASHPSWVTVHPNNQRLYVTGAMKDYRGYLRTRLKLVSPSGCLRSLRIVRPSGRLSSINEMPSEGGNPIHLDVDTSGRLLVASNYDYGGGGVVAFPLREDGGLEPVCSIMAYKGRHARSATQDGPHAHCVRFAPDRRHVVIADLGIDRLYVYKVSSRGSLEENNPSFFALADGSGPRHFAFHPTGRLGYVVNQLNSTVGVFTYDGDRGVLQQTQTVSTVPGVCTDENDPAEVAVDSSGRHLYVSNRGSDNIAVFEIAKGSGHLRPVQFISSQGRYPGGFTFDPTGAYLLVPNFLGDNVVVFHVDRETGRLSPTGNSVTIRHPSCVVLTPATT